MPMMTEYKVLEYNTAEVLKLRVEGCLQHGWSLQGGVAVYVDPRGITQYVQALVREVVRQ